jgi:hypothetical protein
MSRFERRMGTGPYAKSNASTRKYTPNLNESNKPLPSRNEIMSTQSENTYSANIIDEVSEKNERILKKLDSTKSSSERILLNHELRLNTIELNIDFLSNMEKNENDFTTNSLQETKIETLERTVNELSEKLILLTQMIQENSVNKPNDNVTMDVNDIAKNNINKKVEKIVEKNNEGPTFE